MVEYIQARALWLLSEKEVKVKEKKQGTKRNGIILSALTMMLFASLAIPSGAFVGERADNPPSYNIAQEDVSPARMLGVDDASLGSAVMQNVAQGQKINYNLPGVSNKSIYAYSRMTTKVNEKTVSDQSLIINGIAYIPLRSTVEAIGGGSVSYDSAARTVTVEMKGMRMTVADGAFVTYVNDRPFFNFSPAVIMSNGKMYIPASTLAKATGTQLQRTESTLTLKGAYRAPKDAKSFYREDEVLWLSRIIAAESSGESLLGQIAVGDVILNRVRSSEFPNTIWSVIFDRKYGVQFSPVANGTIYNEPTYTATLAAKICLEGTSLSDNAMYFINPVKAPDSWVSKNRQYAYTIGNHDFYL